MAWWFRYRNESTVQSRNWTCESGASGRTECINTVPKTPTKSPQHPGTRTGHIWFSHHLSCFVVLFPDSLYFWTENKRWKYHQTLISKTHRLVFAFHFVSMPENCPEDEMERKILSSRAYSKSWKAERMEMSAVRVFLWSGSYLKLRVQQHKSIITVHIHQRQVQPSILSVLPRTRGFWSVTREQWSVGKTKPQN